MLLTNEELDALNVLISLVQIDIICDKENEFWNELRRKLRALNVLISLEQIDIINDEENEFWNTIRRKLRHLTYQSAL